MKGTDIYSFINSVFNYSYRAQLSSEELIRRFESSDDFFTATKQFCNLQGQCEEIDMELLRANPIVKKLEILVYISRFDWTELACAPLSFQSRMQR